MTFHFKKPIAGLTVLLADLRTDEILAEAPASNLKFGSLLMSPQDFSFDLALGSKKANKLDLIGGTVPRQRAVYIDYEGELVYGGAVWGRSYDSEGSRLSVVGSELITFYQRQYALNNLNFDDTDQLEIARRIFSNIALRAGSNLDLEVTDNDSPIVRDRNYYFWSFKDVYQLLDQLANVSRGFEYGVDLSYDADHRPHKTLTLSYPTRGAVQVPFNLLFDFPGNLTRYYWPEDASTYANEAIAIGKGDGDKQIMAIAEDTDVIAGGVPRLSVTYSYKDISHLDTLQTHADKDLAYAEQIFKLGTFYTQVDADPVFGSYNVGDLARFKLKSDFHDIDTEMRLFGWGVDGSTGNMTITAGTQVKR